MSCLRSPTWGSSGPRPVLRVLLHSCTICHAFCRTFSWEKHFQAAEEQQRQYPGDQGRIYVRSHAAETRHESMGGEGGKSTLKPRAPPSCKGCHGYLLASCCPAGLIDIKHCLQDIISRFTPGRMNREWTPAFDSSRSRYSILACRNLCYFPTCSNNWNTHFPCRLVLLDVFDRSKHANGFEDHVWMSSLSSAASLARVLGPIFARASVGPPGASWQLSGSGHA